MDSGRIAVLREVLEGGQWLSGARNVARAIHRHTQVPRGLLLVGTPTEEPWHLAAHLQDEARLGGMTHLVPTLVRWAPPPGAPDHLAVDLSRLERAGRGETVFVVNPDVAEPEGLLQRVHDARRTGATVVALDRGDSQLSDMAHEHMSVTHFGLAVPRHVLDTPLSQLPPFSRGPHGPWHGEEPPPAPERDDPRLGFDVAQHLISAETGAIEDQQRRDGWRERLGQLLDTVAGAR